METFLRKNVATCSAFSFRICMETFGRVKPVDNALFFHSHMTCMQRCTYLVE